jgi:WXG100 family type VII secretion target
MSDADYMNIRFETLEQAQTDLATGYAAAKQTIEDLKAKLNQNLADWNGDARETYAQVQNDWDKAFAHMAAVLQKAHVHIGNAHEMYTQVERQNKSIWHG